MEDLLLNFAQHNKAILYCLKSRFKNTLNEADLADAISTAYEKLLLESSRPVPRLTMSFGTLKYLSYLAAVDSYRKTRRITYVDTLVENGPLSKSLSDAALLDQKQLLEEVIAVVATLPPQRRRMIEAKYDAFNFEENATHADMIAAKNHRKYSAKNAMSDLGFLSETAARQTLYRALTTIRSSFARA